MPITDEYANRTLDALYGDLHASEAPASYYVALFSAAPTVAGGGTELSGDGYARVEVENTTAEWPLADDRAKHNANDIEWPTATDDWDGIVSIGLYDAAVAGNLVHYFSIDTLVVLDGETYSVQANNLVIRIS